MEKVTTIIGALVVVGIVGFIAFGGAGQTSIQNPSEVGVESKVVASVHKSPTCGCCGVYVSYMSKEGYIVEVHDTNDLYGVKESLGVPPELESCHTTEVAGYVVEGHIPNEAIKKLLAEKPDIKGIGMPGMPAGSPGMPGPKRGEFTIYEITHEGGVGEIFMTI